MNTTRLLIETQVLIEPWRGPYGDLPLLHMDAALS